MKTSILNLPHDLLVQQIIPKLPFSDVISLCQTNQQLHYFSMGSTPRQRFLWKILIQNTFTEVYDYQNKLKSLSEKFCSNISKNQDIYKGTDGYCYNYLIYVDFVKTLDRATQMIIYHKQCDMKSFSGGSLVDRYMAMFLLKKPSQMNKLYDQMVQGNIENEELREIHQGYKKLMKGQNPCQDILDKILIKVSGAGYTLGVKLILENGAKIHVFDDHALIRTSSNGHTDTVKLLLENGANVHARDDWTLRWASTNGYTETVKILLEHGANIHAQDDFALRWASLNGHTVTVKLLLENGANIHADNDGALQLASKNEHTETVKLLLENGADGSILK